MSGDTRDSCDINSLHLELKNSRNDKRLGPITTRDDSNVEKVKEDIDTECGISNCRPSSLQCCARMLSFSFVCGLATLLSNAFPAYLASQITTLERQYNISSSLSGFMVSSNDVGFALTVIIFSHFCKKYHGPRILGVCTILLGVAAIATVIPHLITWADMLDYSYINPVNNISMLCNPRYNSTSQSSSCTVTSPTIGNLTWIVVFMCICLIMQGIGTSPRSALGTIYVDNNVDKKKTGFYLGIIQTIGIFGPFIAPIVGSLVGRLPVDLKETTIIHLDPRWIGAWWIGYLAFGSVAIICGIMFLLFPRKLTRNDTELKNTKELATEQKEDKSNIRELPKSFVRILCNPVQTFNLLAAITAMLSVAVLSSFGPKYMEVQFNLPTTDANLIIGVQNLVTACLGMYLGGYLVMRLKLDRNGCLKMVVITHILWCIFKSLQYIVGCDNPAIHNEDLESPLACSCQNVQFLSVCGFDGKTYYSPCHAGCINVTTSYLYGGCSLINGTGQAKPGICDSGCRNLIPFIATSIGHVFVGTMAVMPIYIAFLRSAEERDRALTMGILTFSLAAFVAIPGPILVGMLIDTTCKIWRTSCGTEGACALYDVVAFRIRLISADFALNVIATIFNILTLIAALNQTRKLAKKEKKLSSDLTTKQNNENEAQINMAFF